ncbi:MAG: glycosyltransferase, partial [Acidimicrobiales bacterium]|nr:glycosyltransferase [Acidimicrobiales bacterium]
AAFALLGGATVAVCTALVARSKDRNLALWCGGAVAVVVVVADGAPWMGTDVGGILTLVPVLCLMFWALSGRRVRWHTIGLAVLAAAVVLGIAVGVESLRDPGQRTHIGRFFLESADGTTVQDTFRRKWDANTAVLRSSPLAWAVPIIAGAGFVAVASGRFFRRVLPLQSPERTGVTSTLAMGFVGWILNDSGVVVLALASVFLGPYILLLAQARTQQTPGASGSQDGLLSPDDAVPPGSVTTAMSADVTEESALPVGAVVAIVPAKDRADSVGATVRGLLGLDGLERVLVVDDGSSDDTAEEALKAGAEVLKLPENLGKGGAVAAAVAATPDAEAYLLIDADVGEYATEAGTLLAPLLEDRADLVIGVLPSPGSKGGFGNVRRFSRWGVRRACGLDTRAPLSGQRAVRAELLRGLESSNRFGLEVAMTIDSVRSGARVLEVDVPMEHRHTGRSVSGFSHRGAQGLDIARSLWPRLLSPRTRRTGVALLVLAFVVGSYFTASAARPDSVALVPGASRVVLVGIPDLALADLSGGAMPNLAEMAGRGALGWATPRTRGAVNQVSVYASIGAGDRVRAGSQASLAVGPDELVEGDPASVVVSRRAGAVGDGNVLLPAIASVIDNAGTGVDSLPGALGTVLGEAGMKTAVVANSNRLTEDGEQDLSAPAALAVVDRQGSIDLGAVGTELLRTAPSSPFGIEADPEAFAAAVAEAVMGAELTVVDPGEMDRYLAYRSHLVDDLREAARLDALTRTDAIIGSIRDSLSDDTLLIVTGVTPGPGGKLVPIVLNGRGVSGGGITSASTRRPDLVTITDLAPTILQSLGLRAPDSMIGRPVGFTADRPSLESLQRQEDVISGRDDVYGDLHRTFITFTIGFYAVAAFVLLRRRTTPTIERVMGVVALTTATWPISGFLARLVPASYSWGWGSHLVVWVLSAAIAWLALRVSRRPLDALLLVAVITASVTVLDVATGAHLQVSSYLGYTPSVAARFIGLGNLAFGILAGSVLLTCALVVARSDRPRDAWWVAAGIGVVAVVADGAPWLGADVGGVLSLVPALGVMLLLLAGRRVTWKMAGGIILASLVVLGLSIGWESSRPADERTHIGRFFLGDGGFATTIGRKWDVNVHLLTNSRWSWLIVGLGGFVVAILAFGDRWKRLLARRRAESAGVVGLVVVAVLGWATNDSGPLIAGIVLVYLAPLVLLIAVHGPVEDPVLLAPAATDVPDDARTDMSAVSGP